MFVERDLDDTVIRPVRALLHDETEDLSDTIISGEVAARRNNAERSTDVKPSSGVEQGVSPRPDRRQPESSHVPQSPQAPPATQALPRYGFRVNTSEPVGLDRPAYVGRRPSLPRVVGTMPPRMITVPSPLGEVSGTHLELHMQGAMVIATDLRSTNGTSVSIPGAVPVRLRQNDSIVVSPGTLIEIGDNNVIEILSMRRTHPSNQNSGVAHP